MLHHTHDRRRGKAPQRIRTGARMMVACIYCKDHKLKCDNGVPSCASCVRFRQTCLVEDPITKRHQPRNYLEMLETHIAHLEGLLQGTGATPAPFPVVERRADSTPASAATPVPAATPTTPSTDDDDDVDSLAATVGMLGICATGMEEPRYLGSSSAFAFSRAIRASLLLRDAGPAGGGGSSPAVVDGGGGHDAAARSCVLPTYEDGLVLSNAYFENMHIHYPFLHEPTFRRWEVEVQRAAPRPADADAGAFFVYMVYAIGALLLPATRYGHEQLYARALRHLDPLLQGDNLQSVQALVACCAYSLRSPAGPSLWKLTGAALRQCVELGYHRSGQRCGRRPRPGDAAQAELRKRVFWTVFAMDCSVALFLGRPLGLSVWEMDVELPQNIGDGPIVGPGLSPGIAPPAADLSVALHMFRLRLLWAQIHTALFTDTRRVRTADPAYAARVAQLRAELDAWRAAAPAAPPPRRGAALTLFGSADWYDTNYSHTVLLLHRHQLVEAGGRTTREGPASPPDPAVVLACLDAAERIARGYYRQYVLGRVGCTWGCLHLLFLAGLTYLHCLWTSPAARAARSGPGPGQLAAVSSTCTDCAMVLAVIAARWARAAPYRDIFETLARKTLVMMMGVGAATAGSAAATATATAMPSDAAPSASAWTAAALDAADRSDGGLEDPWEVMQWINEELLEAADGDAFSFGV